MAKHRLSLETLDTLNEGILRIWDTSVYDSQVTVDCPILEITLPGFAYSVQFSTTTTPAIAPGFTVNLTACDLEIQTADCGTVFNKLPDGIYILKYSVSPNDVVYVEYNHLRVSQLMNTYQQALCALDLAKCDPLPDVQKKLDLLNQVKMYIEAAKAKVEICHEPRKGMELYSYARILLNKLGCRTCQ